MTSAVYKVILELTDKFLTVAQVKSTMTTFIIINELAFVEYPDVFWVVEIAEIIFRLNFMGILVVENSMAVERIMTPFALICYSSVRIVKSTTAVHFTVQPVSAVLSALVVVKYSVSISETIGLTSFIPSSCQSLFYIVWIGHIRWRGSIGNNLRR